MLTVVPVHVYAPSHGASDAEKGATASSNKRGPVLEAGYHGPPHPIITSTILVGLYTKFMNMTVPVKGNGHTVGYKNILYNSLISNWCQHQQWEGPLYGCDGQASKTFDHIVKLWINGSCKIRKCK